MFPHTMSRLDPSANAPDPPPASDLTCILEQHIAAGFSHELALDLVLNELVVRAADATQASAAALALTHGDEMVYRAATGVPTRDLGVPFDTQDGLGAACLRTRAPQLSTDTNSDPRVDAAVFHNLGVRSMLIVPVFDERSRTAGAEPPLAGVLEILSPLPNAFNQSTQTLLQEYARECTRIRQAAAQLSNAQPAAESSWADAELPTPGAGLPASGADLSPPHLSRDSPPSASPRVPLTYEGWTLAFAVLVFLAAVAVSLMIATRTGWLRAPQTASSIQPAAISTGSATLAAAPSSPAARRSTIPRQTKAATNPPSKPATHEPARKPATNKPASSADELVVYDKGKIVFRLAPAPASSAVSAEGSASIPAASSAQSASGHSTAKSQGPSPVVPAAETTRTPSPRAVWLAPPQAERRLLTRVEPQYPADALAAHRSGVVVLEVHVAENGTVSVVHTLSGDPILAIAAAEAVRHWRYQPYSVLGRPAEFQTDVTLKFSLPN